LADFDSVQISRIRSDVAALTGAAVSEITVSVSAGSVIVTITMASSAATSLMSQIASVPSLGGVTVVGAYSNRDAAAAESRVGSSQPVDRTPPTVTPAPMSLSESTNIVSPMTEGGSVELRSVFMPPPGAVSKYP